MGRNSVEKLLLLLLALTLLLFAGCQAGNSAVSDAPPTATQAHAATPAPATEAPVAVVERSAPADGVYSAEFITDSSMFRVNEANDGKGALTVTNGVMTLHVNLPSKSVLDLFVGSAEDAQKDGAALLMPTIDTVTYDDGATEEVHGFDIPVPALDTDFALSLIGTKGKWYDHTVSVTNAMPVDGRYIIEATLSGGSGRASIASPAALTVQDGQATAAIVWSSPFYEWMQVDGVRYEPVQTEGNATFSIPVTLDADMPVSAQTVAMSEPHIVEYTLRFDVSTLKTAE